MITFLLLLPVGSILVWLYWFCLPTDKLTKSRWHWVDTLLLLLLMTLASLFVYAAIHAEYINAGAIWSEIVAVTGAYGIIAIGLSIGLILRRRFARNK